MVSLDIPDRPAAITAEWLTAGLRAGSLLGAGDRVSSATAEVIGADRGIGGQVVRLRVTYERDRPGLPATLIAKLPSALAVTRAGGRFLRLPEREVRFYRELASLVPVRVPACHYSDIDDEGDAFVLLLEDLGGAAAGDDLAGASDAQLEAAVEALAGLHAAFWGNPLLEALGWMPAIDERAATWQRLFSVAWREARDAAAAGDESAQALLDIVPAEARELVEELTRSGRRAVEQLGRGPSTLLHGDFRLDNLFFAPIAGGAPLAVIDWSNATRGTGPYDLAYLFAVGLTPERRRGVEDHLLARYHAALAEHGVEGYDHARCRRDYAVAYLEPLTRMFFLLARGHTQAGGERAHQVLGRVVRHAACAALDLDAMSLIEDADA